MVTRSSVYNFSWSVTLVLMMGILVISATSPVAADVSDFDYKLTVGGTQVEITGYRGSNTDVVVPARIDGLSVTSIGDSAFKSTSVTSVMIPSGVMTIGPLAFQDCTSLTSISFLGPVAPTSIGNNWVKNTDPSILGHAYAASDFPTPGNDLSDLTIGVVIAVTPPDAPTGLKAVAGNDQVTLNWTAPANIGDSAIDHYIVYQDTVDVAYPTTLTTTITGLTSGLSYSFTVSAHNSVEEGAQSGAVSSIPYTYPDAPTGLKAVAGNDQVALNWTAPAYDGDSAIDYYVIYQDGLAKTDHPTGLTTIVSGLTNGVGYSFTVAAHNPAGEGAQSSSTSATPVGLPGIPTGLKAVAGNDQVALNWTAPAFDGGSAIDYYVLYQETFDIVHTTSLTATITGLTNGHSYSFTIAAHTPVGTGTQSGAVSSTPYTIPNAPTGLTAVGGNAHATLDWASPAFNGGSAIIGYNVYRSTSETGDYSIVNSPSDNTYIDTGLTNGQIYWYKVSAVNAAGEGAMTAPASTIPFTVPNAPTGLTAVGGNAQVTLNWTAPIFNGGSAIDYYVIYQNGIAQAGHLTEITTTVTGLINGLSYSFTVAAHNPAGEGAQSTATSSTPYTVPNAPTGLTAVASNAQVALNWTAPADNGGSAIDYYIVYRDGIADPSHPTGSTTVMTGLTNGQEYSFTVAAHSVIGIGAPSVAATATPHTGPSAPTGLTAVAGNAQVTLNWTAPANNGGSAILGYNLYRSTTQSGIYSLIESPTGRTFLDGSLTNGQTYWYKVCAVNAAGEGAQSGAVSSTPYTLPNAPTGLTAVAGNAQVALNWTAPANNGGSAIDYYVIYQGGIALTSHPTGLTTIVSGLTNGVGYSFTVAAHNLAGEGAQSSSASATPVALPGVPTGLTAVAGNAQVTLNWTAHANNGGNTIDYYIIYQDGVDVSHPTTLMKTITGLTNGHSYSFTVAAHTLVGTGAQSGAVSSTPYTLPNAPTGLTAVAGNAQVTLNWTAPANNGGNAIDYYVIYQGGVALGDHRTGTMTIISGLMNGVGYSFTVAAHNPAGEGAQSSPAISTSLALPGIPTGLTVVAGEGQVTLNWTAPSDTGGNTIDYYVIYQDGVDLYHPTLLTMTITGLTSWRSYSFTIAAHTLVGTGAQSAAISSTPYTVPGAPTGLTAVAGNAQVTLNWTAPVSNGGRTIDYYIIYQGRVALTGHVTGLKTVITSLTNGQSYTFNVRAYNNAGMGPLSSAAIATPVVITYPPVVVITSPANGSYSNTGSIFLSWSAVGSGSDVINIQVRSDNDTWITVTGKGRTITGLSEGSHKIYVQATDQAGKVNTTSVSFIVDTTLPTSSIDSPTSGAYLTDHSVLVSWTVSDTGSGLANTEVSADGKNWTKVVGTSTRLTLADGSRTIYLRATDKAGNSATNSVTVMVDTTAPTLISRTPTGTTALTRSTVNITFSEAMNTTASSIVVKGVYGSTIWNGNNAVFMPAAALTGRTSYEITVTGTDLAGNTMTQSWNFTTANVAKIYGIVHGHDGQILANALVRLIGPTTTGQTSMAQVTMAIASTGGHLLATTTTDSDGQYAFYDVAVGSYTLEITETGFGVQTRSVTMTAEAVALGGLSSDQTILAGSQSDDIIMFLAIAILAIAIVVLVLIVRRRKVESPPKVPAVAEKPVKNKKKGSKKKR